MLRAGRNSRPQADTRRIAEDENPAEVVREHDDTERQPELPTDNEHAQRDGNDDASIAGGGDKALAHAGEQMAADERLAGLGNLQTYG